MFCVAWRGDIPTRDTPASKENAKSSKRYIERKEVDKKELKRDGFSPETDED